jgi:acyl-CoA thioesterase I
MNIPSQHLLWSALLAAAVSGAACRDAEARRPAPLDPLATVASHAPPPGVPRGGTILANPLLSRGKRVVGWSPVRFAEAKNVNDGDPRTTWDGGKPTPERPAWVALDIGRGPTRVLLTWSAAGSFNYDETDYGSPGAYRIETSPDSTDGEDGAWRVALRVAPVLTHGQAHSLDFTGQRWVKLVVTAAPSVSPNGVQVDEIGVHDVSAGVGDAWFFMGDSITAFAFGRAPPELGFATRVRARHGRHFPAVINGGIGGEKSDDGVRHIDERLAQNPDVRFFCLAYGTNDAAGDASDTSRFEANLQAMIDRVRAAGRVPILATIPFASDGQHRHIPRFNAVIDELRRANALPRGPDLYAWFAAHPDELRDGLHPDDRGIGSVNRLWAEAVDALYPP